MRETADCRDYHHPPQSLHAARDKLRPSVLHIVSGNIKGTAFLIDREAGLFLTARHVVENSINSKEIPVQGFFEERSAKAYSLVVVKEDASFDVALLQTQPTLSFTDREEFELSFADSPSQKIGVFGSAHSSTNQADVNVRPAEAFSFDLSSGLMKVSVAARPGDSGGPVIKDDDGLVIAVILQNKSTDLALGRPIGDVAEFVSEHSMNNLPATMLSILDGTSPPQQDVWHNTFRTKGSGRLSNFRLAGMIRAMWERRHENRKPTIYSKIKGCDIHTVALNRELGMYAGFLFHMANTPRGVSTSQGAKAAFDSAEKQKKMGRKQLARALYQTAASLYLEDITNRLKESSGGGYLTALLAGSGYVVSRNNKGSIELDDFRPGTHGTKKLSAKQFTKAIVTAFGGSIDVVDIPVSKTTRRGDRMAILFHDYQTARLRAAELSPHPFTSAIVRDAFVSAAWGSQIARSGAYRSLNYQAMGDALIRLNRFKEAAAAYASAWQGGLESEVVLKNYGYARSLSANQLLAGVPTIKGEISAAAKMDPKTLHGLIVSFSPM